QELQVYTAALDLMAAEMHGERVEGEDRVKLSTDDRAWAYEIAHSLADGQDARGVWDYDVGGGAHVFSFGHGYYDHSNMQYALLGLKSASRCGIRTDPGVWKRALQHFVAAQQKSGPSFDRGAAPPTGADKGRTAARPVDHARGWGYQ